MMPARRACAAIRYRVATRGPRTVGARSQEIPMDEETFNLSIRKFLKVVGVGSQREIEQAVARALADARIAGTETLPAFVTLEVPGLGLKVNFDGEIRLQ
jgi:hypothetical protein